MISLYYTIFFELNHIPAIFHILFTSTIRGEFMFLVVSMHVDGRPLFVLWWGGVALYIYQTCLTEIEFD